MPDQHAGRGDAPKIDIEGEIRHREDVPSAVSTSPAATSQRASNMRMRMLPVIASVMALTIARGMKRVPAAAGGIAEQPLAE